MAFLAGANGFGKRWQVVKSRSPCRWFPSVLNSATDARVKCGESVVDREFWDRFFPLKPGSVGESHPPFS